MIAKKTIKFKTKTNILDTIQYFLSTIITICFALGLIPMLYYKVAPVLISVLIIQIIISIVRLRILNLVLELILLIISIISFIPFLGWIFRLIGFIASLLDMATQKNQGLYKQVEIRTFKSKYSPFTKKSNKIKKSKPKFKDAEFKEK